MLDRGRMDEEPRPLLSLDLRRPGPAPDPDRVVSTAGRQPSAVGAEGDAPEVTLREFERAELSAIRRVPDAHLVTLLRGPGDPLAVGVICKAGDERGARDGQDLASRIDLRELDQDPSRFPLDRGQAPAVRAEACDRREDRPRPM